MLIVRRLTKALLDTWQPVAAESLAGEEAVLRIGRSGFSLGYMSLPRAEWRSFPMMEEAEPARLADDPDAAVFAAYQEGRFVGSAAVRATKRGYGDVLDVRVDAPFRRGGVARALLAACERFAAQREMRALRLCCTDNNPVACQFCEHCGFTLQGLDRSALAYAPSEREKPMARRACMLFFYRPIGKE